jgi:XTP/dITP diphosphohydrolase
LRPALILGTKNQGKVVEIQRILSALELDLIPLSTFSQAPDVVEDGQTFRDNAIKKACTVAAWSGRPTLAEDSGLEVAALGGQPGVYTARFGGPGLTARQRCQYLLNHLQGVADAERQAVFRCVAVLVNPSGCMVIREGHCRGYIGHTLQGDEGFGYDPLFIVPEFGRTLAELSPSDKDLLSHRAQALQAMWPFFATVTAQWP